MSTRVHMSSVLNVCAYVCVHVCAGLRGKCGYLG
jgi:hypothetical protein